MVGPEIHLLSIMLLKIMELGYLQMEYQKAHLQAMEELIIFIKLHDPISLRLMVIKLFNSIGASERQSVQVEL